MGPDGPCVSGRGSDVRKRTLPASSRSPALSLAGRGISRVEAAGPPEEGAAAIACLRKPVWGYQTRAKKPHPAGDVARVGCRGPRFSAFRKRREGTVYRVI